jgi:hypothetical protein
MNRQISQHLAIDLDASLVQAIHKATVGHIKLPCSSIDTHNPQTTELTLALTTVTICVLTCLDNSLFGNPVNLATGTVITFSLL